MKDHYTYRVTWSEEDGEYVGLCVEFPSLSWLSPTPEEAFSGIRRVVANRRKHIDPWRFVRQNRESA